MIENERIFNESDHLIFDSCCQYFELSLSYFNYNVQAECYVSDEKKPLLFAVHLFYEGQEHRAFTALSLTEFHKKMELVYQLYLYAKEQRCSLEKALAHFSETDERFLAIQIDIDDLRNWREFIDEALKQSEGVGYDIRYAQSRTVH